MLNAFAEGQEERSIRDIQPVDLLDWVQARYPNPESQKTTLTPLFGMFRWAASPQRRLVDAEWNRRVPKSERALGNKKLPSVLAPSDLAAIQRNAPQSIIPTLALGAFAGIRPEELTSESPEKDVLTWAAINFEMREITIPAEVSKTRQEATLRGLPDNLWTWLETVLPESRSGRICACNHRNFRKSRRKALQAATTLQDWPKDVLRHSFATYNYQIRGLEHTLDCMRHIGGSKMLWKHYKGDAWKSRAEEYFGILP